MDLKEFFNLHSKAAVAFSGGVDSAYLLYAAREAKADVRAYYVKSAFQPQFEYEDAIRFAAELCIDMEVIRLDVLEDACVRENPRDRCYYCKRKIFQAILSSAKRDGYSVLLDGTNASDMAADRPGMRALSELSVLSPLRQCGLTKERIRMLSRQAGLFTWDKPAYACLATRIPAGEEITPVKLQNIEDAEACLFSLGFTDFRVRTAAGEARLQLREEQFDLLYAHRAEILDRLKKVYKTVSLDLEVRG